MDTTALALEPKDRAVGRLDECGEGIESAWDANLVPCACPSQAASRHRPLSVSLPSGMHAAATRFLTKRGLCNDGLVLCMSSGSRSVTLALHPCTVPYGSMKVVGLLFVLCFPFFTHCKQAHAQSTRSHEALAGSVDGTCQQPASRGCISLFPAARRRVSGAQIPAGALPAGPSFPSHHLLSNFPRKT